MEANYSEFPHHRLDAWKLSLEVARQAKGLADRVPRGYRTFADQLMRSAGNAVHLIGEGANRYGAGLKRQRYTEARGEIGEAAASAELLATLGLVPRADADRFVAASGRVAAMLTRLIQRFS